jgi:hypothetical protein
MSYEIELYCNPNGIKLRDSFRYSSTFISPNHATSIYFSDQWQEAENRRAKLEFSQSPKPS